MASNTNAKNSGSGFSFSPSPAIQSKPPFTPDFWAALILLLITYVVLVVQAALLSPAVAIGVTALWIAVVAIALLTQRCVRTGGCPRLSWFYIVLYAIVLVSCIAVTAVRYCDYRNERRQNPPSRI